MCAFLQKLFFLMQNLSFAPFQVQNPCVFCTKISRSDLWKRSNRLRKARRAQQVFIALRIRVWYDTVKTIGGGGITVVRIAILEDEAPVQEDLAGYLRRYTR